MLTNFFLVGELERSALLRCHVSDEEQLLEVA